MGIRKAIDFQYKQVIVVRSDLKLSAGKQAVQVAHGAVTAAIASKKSHARYFKEWFAEGQKKVVVKAPTLRDLYEIKSLAEAAKLPTSLIQDAGLTEIPPGTVTCLCIGPAPNPEIDKITGSLKLL